MVKINKIKMKQLEEKLKKLPEVQAGKGIWQNKFHEFDIYNHTLAYVSALKKITSNPELIVAGYLHDIGKPVVRVQEVKDGKLGWKAPGIPYYDFHGHEIKGEKMVRKMSPELFLEFGLNQEKIAKLVGAHYLPMQYIKEMRKTRNYVEFSEKYQELVRALNSTGLKREEVMDMFIADCISKGSKTKDLKELKLVREVILSNDSSDILKTLYEMQKKIYGGKE